MSQPQPPRWQPPQQPITWGTSQPGPQQPPHPPQWGTPPPQPPRAPKPKNKVGKILGIVAVSVVGFFVVALTIGAIVGEDQPDKEKAPAAAEREASTSSTAGDLPPKPKPETRTAYLADLDAIDPDIVHGEGDKAVSRGRSQCSSFKTVIDGKKLDRAKLIEYTNYRFSSPDHPNGHGTVIAEQILDVVHKHLCPTY